MYYKNRLTPNILFSAVFFCLAFAPSVRAKSVYLSEMNLTLVFENIKLKHQKELVRVTKSAYQKTCDAIDQIDKLNQAGKGIFSSRENKFIASFGSCTPSSRAKVRSNLILLKKQFSGVVVFKQSSKMDTNRAAHVKMGRSKVNRKSASVDKMEKVVIVYLYQPFWKYSQKNRLIIHELSHVAFNSKDGFDLNHDGKISKSELFYGKSECHQLVTKHPHHALSHADSYSFYAE
jgi:hypothetical protein